MAKRTREEEKEMELMNFLHGTHRNAIKPTLAIRCVVLLEDVALGH